MVAIANLGQVYQPVNGNTTNLASQHYSQTPNLAFGYHGLGITGSTHSVACFGAQDADGNQFGAASVVQQSGTPHILRTWASRAMPWMFFDAAALSAAPDSVYVSDWSANTVTFKGSTGWSGETRAYQSMYTFSGGEANVKEVNAPLSTGNVAYDCGFRPKALILITSKSYGTGFTVSVAGEAGIGWGFTDGTNEWCQFSTNTIVSGGGEGYAVQKEKLGTIHTSTGSNIYDISLVSFDTSGYTLHWDLNGSALNYKVGVIALGGNDFDFGVAKNTVPTSTGTQEIALGTRPLVCMIGDIGDDSVNRTEGSHGSHKGTWFDHTALDRSGGGHNAWAMIDHATLARGYRDYQRPTGGSQDSYSPYRVYSWSMNQVAAAYVHPTTNGISLDWYDVDGTEYDFIVFGIGQFVIDYGWTNRGRYNLLSRIFRGVALPGNYYLALVTGATRPTPDTNTFGQLTEIAAGNGYTSGGVQLSLNTTDFESATEDDTDDFGQIHLRDVDWTATGTFPSSGDPAAFAVLTDDNGTIANREVLYYWSLKTPQTLIADEIMRLDLSMSVREPA